MKKQTKLDENEIRILKERDVKYVNMDIEMGDNVYQKLIDHAVMNILNDKEALLNWAFVDILEKSIDYTKTKPVKKNTKVK